MAYIELLDEIAEWLETLSDAEHERVVVLIDRLAERSSRARKHAVADAASNP